MNRTISKYRKLNTFRKLVILLVFVFTLVIKANAQEITVNGVVEDQQGSLIENAVITIDNNTTLTNKFGKFSINVKKNDLLKISKAGYKTQTIKAKTAVLVKLSIETRYAQVASVYETVAMGDVTSSISTVNSQKLSNNSVLAFGNGLYGKLTGLNLSQADGEPGNDYPAMLIRGKHSFTGNNKPLVLVDGFERELNTLSVDEVESVSVLKDAASTALYGMDGANGIVLVTTKRGIAGKTEVGLKVEMGEGMPTRIPHFYGSYDYARFYNQAQKNDGKTTFLYSDAQLEGYRLNQDQKLFPNVDWVNEIIREKAPIKKYIVDFRGGNEIAKYYVNVGLENAEGIFKNTEHIYADESGTSYSTNRNLQRINFRSNIDVNVNKRFNIRLDLAGRLESVNSPTTSTAAIFNNLYGFHPNVSSVYASPGVYGGSNSYQTNPLAYLNEQGYTDTHRRYFQSNIVAKYDLTDLVQGLQIGFKASLDNYYTVRDGFKKTFAVVDSTGKIFGTNTNLQNTGKTNQSELRSNNYEFFTEYNRTFNKNTVGALIMFHQDEYVDSTDFPDRRLSVSGKLSYGYNNKYIVNLAAQYGATENFMKGRRYGFFPAVSGAWIASEESFMQNIAAISFLKFRASTGLVGNQNVGGTRFGYNTLYNTNGSEKELGNPYLTWEKAYKTDVGVDATLWKDIDVNLTYFHEFRDDILNSGSSLTPNYFGNSFGYSNYGQVKSDGLEITISTEKKFTNWGYHAGLNATYVTNEVVRMQEVTRQWDYLYMQGNPVGQRFGLVAEGLFQSQDEIDKAPVQTFGKVIPGSIKYKNMNNDGVINSDDYVAIGKDATVPTLSLGFNLGFDYSGFYVDANFQAAIGREVNMRSDSEGAMYSIAPLYGDRNVSTYVKNPWTLETAATADYPSLSIENAANNFVTSSYWLRNGDFLRLRSMELGYNLPKHIVGLLKLNKVNIYLRGMNLLTLDHIKYFDPEVMEGYPVTKSYHIGLNIKF